MQLYPGGVDNIFTVYPNIGEIVEKHRKKGKSPEALALYMAALIIARELSRNSDADRLIIFLKLRR
jgi:hypothetical protein